MDFEIIKNLITEKKTELIKENIDIIKAYLQIKNNIVQLKNNIFLNIAFTKNSEWDDQKEVKSDSFNFQEKYDLRFMTPELNNQILDDIFFKLNIIKDNYLSSPENINESQYQDIVYFNTSLIDFINTISQKYNDKIQGIEKKILAKSIKINISDTIKKIIIPFWEGIRDCIMDEIKIEIINDIKKKNNNALKVLNKSEIIAVIIELGYKEYFCNIVSASLEKEIQKPEKDVYNNFYSKYKNRDGKLSASDKIRVKEALNRYLAQERNLDKLKIFIDQVESGYSTSGFFQNFIQSILGFLKGPKYSKKKKLIEFTYSSREGKIARKQSSLVDLRTQINSCKNYIFEKRFELEQDNTNDNMDIERLSLIFRIIDKLAGTLSEIFDKGNGLREWIAHENNSRTLKKIPFRLQEDFTSTLLSINQSLIINRQTLEMLNINTILKEAQAVHS